MFGHPGNFKSLRIWNWHYLNLADSNKWIALFNEINCPEIFLQFIIQMISLQLVTSVWTLLRSVVLARYVPLELSRLLNSWTLANWFFIPLLQSLILATDQTDSSEFKLHKSYSFNYVNIKCKNNVLRSVNKYL